MIDDDNGVVMRSCNRKLKLPLHKSKIGMQSSSYLGTRVWKKHPNYLNIVTSVNCLKRDIRKSFLKKKSDTEGDIYSYV